MTPRRERHAAAASYQDQVLFQVSSMGSRCRRATDDGVSPTRSRRALPSVADLANVKSGGAAAPGGDGDGRLSYPHDGDLNGIVPVYGERRRSSVR
jgi:hypothetical protein